MFLAIAANLIVFELGSSLISGNLAPIFLQTCLPSLMRYLTGEKTISSGWFPGCFFGATSKGVT